MAIEEILACFDKKRINEFETGRFAGIFPKEREIAHQQHIPHLITRIYAIQKGTSKFLVQKRGPRRTSNPNKFTDSASGHVIFRDHLQFEHIAEDAARELREEMGLEPLAMQFLETTFSEIEQELAFAFLALVDGDPKPDPEETDIKASGYYEGGEFAKLLETEEFMPPVKEQWKKILDGNILVNFALRFMEARTNKQNAPKGPGVIIGRFQPFHLGHIALVQEVLHRQGKVIIIIGSKQYSRVPDNPFTFEERVRMIQHTIQEYKIPSHSIEILGIEDKHDAPKWTDSICALIPANAVLYSNSEWIRTLFFARGINLGDVLKYNFNEFNGTAIRIKLFSRKDWQKYVPSATARIVRELLKRGDLDSLLQ